LRRSFKGCRRLGKLPGPAQLDAPRKKIIRRRPAEIHRANQRNQNDAAAEVTRLKLKNRKAKVRASLRRLLQWD
jgi:hypothetical protein